MKLFNIYIKKSKDNAIVDLVAVNSSFSKAAFFFNILWFLQHKMWKEIFSLVLVEIVLLVILQKNFIGESYFIIMEFGLFLMIGLNANLWYEKYLHNKEYKFSGCVFGKNKDEAKLRFISNHFKDKNENEIFCASMIDDKKIQKSQQYYTI